jgi:ornithine carbamoyltransferase
MAEKKRDLLCVTDFSGQEITEIFNFTKKIKKEAKKGKYKPYLKNKTLAMMFSKTSTRTRLSFQVGIYQLGGYGLYIDISKTQLSKGESLYDTANVMGRYLDGIMIRTYDHKDVEELAKHSPIPVINGLTDDLHPCQALSDFFTIEEHKGTTSGLRVVFIGDGNNVARSLMYTSAMLGSHFCIASPKGFELDDKSVLKAKEIAKKTGSKIELTTDPIQASENADVLYTDVWVSMGQEEEKEKRIKTFENYRIDNKIMAVAKKDAIVMHCLPAIRGYEITDEVMDGPNSVVFDEAENRLHVQKAIMVKLMK